MKRLITILLTLVGLLSIAGCNQSQSGTQSITQSPTPPTIQPTDLCVPSVPLEFEGISDYVIEENGNCYLILPLSNQRISVYDSEKPYLDRVDLDVLIEAEDKLNSQVAQYEKTSFFLQIKDERLYLSVEVIAEINPPKSEGGGCGIDHEHVFFDEQIAE